VPGRAGGAGGTSPTSRRWNPAPRVTAAVAGRAGGGGRGASPMSRQWNPAPRVATAVEPSRADARARERGTASLEMVGCARFLGRDTT
jgi:hypothetical protein